MAFDHLPIGLGVAGLGRAFMLTLPSLLADGRFRLVGAAAPRADQREAFAKQFGGRGFADVATLCADPKVEAVYIATPHQMHLEHVLAAVRAGKHVLVEKPLAVSLADAERMVDAARAAGVQIVVGPSHSFDGPVAQADALIRSGRFGRVRMIQSFAYTDFLYRPRRPEELRTADGGGVIFSQAIHQIDTLRLLAGGKARTVFARCGAWDADRPTEGAYAAIVGFEGGAFASVVYSGYAHFDSDEWMDWVGELGHAKDPATYGRARAGLAGVASAQEEIALKQARGFGGGEVPPPAPEHEHFGPVIVSLDRADLRLTPRGVWVYGDTERRFHPAPAAASPRANVLDALWGAVRQGRAPVQTGAWGLANLELCHAILTASQSGKPVALHHQIAA